VVQISDYQMFDRELCSSAVVAISPLKMLPKHPPDPKAVLEQRVTGRKPESLYAVRRRDMRHVIYAATGCLRHDNQVESQRKDAFARKSWQSMKVKPPWSARHFVVAMGRSRFGAFCANRTISGPRCRIVRQSIYFIAADYLYYMPVKDPHTSHWGAENVGVKIVRKVGRLRLISPRS